MAYDDIGVSSPELREVAPGILGKMAIVLPFCAFSAAIGFIVPLVPEFQIRYFKNSSSCALSPKGADAACSAAASFAHSLSQSLYFLGVFAMSPSYGASSDRHGRKMLLLIGMVTRISPMASLCVFPDDLRPFYAATVLSGCAPAPDAMLFAMIADVVPSAQRLRYFGLGTAGFLMSFSLGTGLSSVLRPAVGAHGVVSIGMCTALASALLFALVLPETAPARGARGAVDPQTTYKVIRRQSVARIMVGASGDNSLLTSVGWIALLSFLPQDGVVAISLFYAKHRLGLAQSEISRLGAQMLCIGGLAGVAWLSCGIGLVSKLFGNQARVYQVMLFFNMLHLVGYACLWSRWVFLANALLLGAPIGQPAILRAIVSQALPASCQGRGSGLITSVAGAASAIAPLLFGTMFLEGSQHGMSCLPYLAGTLLVLVSFLLTSRWLVPLMSGSSSLDSALLS